MRVIGTVRIPRGRSTSSSAAVGILSLGSVPTLEHRQLEWLPGSQAWFLPGLQLGQLSSVLADLAKVDDTVLVLRKAGKFAVTGRILASKEVEFIEVYMGSSDRTETSPSLSAQSTSTNNPMTSILEAHFHSRAVAGTFPHRNGSDT